MGRGLRKEGPQGPNSWEVSWSKWEQDWQCLLSKQGPEISHPGGLAGTGEGVSPHPRQFSLYLADWWQQHHTLPCTRRASGHILQHL